VKQLDIDEKAGHVVPGAVWYWKEMAPSGCQSMWRSWPLWDQLLSANN